MELNDILLLQIFLTYVIGLVLTAWKLVWLYLGYKLGIGISLGRRRMLRVEKTKPPFLLLVVVVFICSIAWPWVLLFGVRVGSQVFGWDTTALSGNTAWYLVTGEPAALGVAWFTWVTYRRIERQ